MISNQHKEFWNKYGREIILAVLFIVIYIPVLMIMWEKWWTRDSYYSHGILVPFVSCFLVWVKKDTLIKIPRQSHSSGIPLIAVGLAIYALSSFFRVNFTAGFSMIMVMSGLVLNIFGLKFFLEVLFPIGFLFFMIPLPAVVITNISFKMKLFAATLAAKLLNAMRVPAIQEGSIIRMRHAYVIVDDVCSGLRSLISLTALGSIFAYWINARFIKRLVLFLSTIPIAIITNVCRIIFLSSISEIWGPEYATGLIHDFSGFLVFAIAFVLLFAVGKMLE